MSESKVGLDPDERRMTVGEHLDELRRRVLRSVIYLALALVVCLIFNQHIMGWIVSLPYEVLKELGRDPVIQVLNPAEGFITWLKVQCQDLRSGRNPQAGDTSGTHGPLDFSSAGSAIHADHSIMNGLCQAFGSS